MDTFDVHPPDPLNCFSGQTWAGRPGLQTNPLLMPMENNPLMDIFLNYQDIQSYESKDNTNSIIGKLHGLCSLKELEMKCINRSASLFEREANTKLHVMLALKALPDSPKGQKPDLNDIRPVIWCRRTLYYIMYYIVDSDIISKPYLINFRYSYYDIYHFLEDKLKSIVRDLEVQSCITHRGHIETLEIIIRFLIYSNELLLDSKQHNLRSCITFLKRCMNLLVKSYKAVGDIIYKERHTTKLFQRPNPDPTYTLVRNVMIYESPYEEEFWAYYLILMIPQLLGQKSWTVTRLSQFVPQKFRESPIVQVSLEACLTATILDTKWYYNIIRSDRCQPLQAALLNYFGTHLRIKYLYALMVDVSIDDIDPSVIEEMKSTMGFTEMHDISFNKFLSRYNIRIDRNNNKIEFNSGDYGQLKRDCDNILNISGFNGSTSEVVVKKLSEYNSRQIIFDPDYISPTVIERPISHCRIINYKHICPSTSPSLRRFLTPTNAFNFIDQSGSSQPDHTTNIQDQISNAITDIDTVNGLLVRIYTRRNDTQSTENVAHENVVDGDFHTPIDTTNTAQFNTQINAEDNTTHTTSRNQQPTDDNANEPVVDNNLQASERANDLTGEIKLIGVETDIEIVGDYIRLRNQIDTTGIYFRDTLSGTTLVITERTINFLFSNMVAMMIPTHYARRMVNLIDSTWFYYGIFDFQAPTARVYDLMLHLFAFDVLEILYNVEPIAYHPQWTDQYSQTTESPSSPVYSESRSTIVLAPNRRSLPESAPVAIIEDVSSAVMEEDTVAIIEDVSSPVMEEDDGMEPVHQNESVIPNSYETDSFDQSSLVIDNDEMVCVDQSPQVIFNTDDISNSQHYLPFIIDNDVMVSDEPGPSVISNTVDIDAGEQNESAIPNTDDTSDVQHYLPFIIDNHNRADHIPSVIVEINRMESLQDNSTVVLDNHIIESDEQIPHVISNTHDTSSVEHTPSVVQDDYKTASVQQIYTVVAEVDDTSAVLSPDSSKVPFPSQRSTEDNAPGIQTLHTSHGMEPMSDVRAPPPTPELPYCHKHSQRSEKRRFSDLESDFENEEHSAQRHIVDNRPTAVHFEDVTPLVQQVTPVVEDVTPGVYGFRPLVQVTPIVEEVTEEVNDIVMSEPGDNDLYNNLYNIAYNAGITAITNAHNDLQCNVNSIVSRAVDEISRTMVNVSSQYVQYLANVTRNAIQNPSEPIQVPADLRSHSSFSAMSESLYNGERGSIGDIQNTILRDDRTERATPRLSDDKSYHNRSREDSDEEDEFLENHFGEIDHNRSDDEFYNQSDEEMEIDENVAINENVNTEKVSGENVAIYQSVNPVNVSAANVVIYQNGNNVNVSGQNVVIYQNGNNVNVSGENVVIYQNLNTYETPSCVEPMEIDENLNTEKVTDQKAVTENQLIDAKDITKEKVTDEHQVSDAKDITETVSGEKVTEREVTDEKQFTDKQQAINENNVSDEKVIHENKMIDEQEVTEMVSVEKVNEREVSDEKVTEREVTDENNVTEVKQVIHETKVVDSNEVIDTKDITENEVVDSNEVIDANQFIDEQQVIDENNVVDEQQVTDRELTYEQVTETVSGEKVTDEQEVSDAKEITDEQQVVDESEGTEEKVTDREVTDEQEVTDMVSREKRAIDEELPEKRPNSDFEEIEQAVNIDADKKRRKCDYDDTVNNNHLSIGVNDGQEGVIPNYDEAFSDSDSESIFSDMDPDNDEFLDFTNVVDDVAPMLSKQSSEDTKKLPSDDTIPPKNDTEVIINDLMDGSIRSVRRGREEITCLQSYICRKYEKSLYHESLHRIKQRAVEGNHIEFKPSKEDQFIKQFGVSGKKDEQSVVTANPFKHPDYVPGPDGKYIEVKLDECVSRFTKHYNLRKKASSHESLLKIDEEPNDHDETQFKDLGSLTYEQFLELTIPAVTSSEDEDDTGGAPSTPGDVTPRNSLEMEERSLSKENPSATKETLAGPKEGTNNSVKKGTKKDKRPQDPKKKEHNRNVLQRFFKNMELIPKDIKRFIYVDLRTSYSDIESAFIKYLKNNASKDILTPLLLCSNCMDTLSIVNKEWPDLIKSKTKSISMVPSKSVKGLNRLSTMKNPRVKKAKVKNFIEMARNKISLALSSLKLLKFYTLNMLRSDTEGKSTNKGSKVLSPFNSILSKTYNKMETVVESSCKGIKYPESLLNRVTVWGSEIFVHVSFFDFTKDDVNVLLWRKMGINLPELTEKIDKYMDSEYCTLMKMDILTMCGFSLDRDELKGKVEDMEVSTFQVMTCKLPVMKCEGHQDNIRLSFNVSLKHNINYQNRPLVTNKYFEMKGPTVKASAQMPDPVPVPSLSVGNENSGDGSGSGTIDETKNATVDANIAKPNTTDKVSGLPIELLCLKVNSTISVNENLRPYSIAWINELHKRKPLISVYPMSKTLKLPSENLFCSKGGDEQTYRSDYLPVIDSLWILSYLLNKRHPLDPPTSITQCIVCYRLSISKLDMMRVFSTTCEMKHSCSCSQERSETIESVLRSLNKSLIASLIAAGEAFNIPDSEEMIKRSVSFVCVGFELEEQITPEEPEYVEELEPVKVEYTDVEVKRIIYEDHFKKTFEEIYDRQLLEGKIRVLHMPVMMPDLPKVLMEFLIRNKVSIEPMKINPQAILSKVLDNFISRATVECPEEMWDLHRLSTDYPAFGKDGEYVDGKYRGLVVLKYSKALFLSIMNSIKDHVKQTTMKLDMDPKIEKTIMDNSINVDHRLTLLRQEYEGYIRKLLQCSKYERFMVPHGMAMFMNDVNNYL